MGTWQRETTETFNSGTTPDISEFAIYSDPAGRALNQAGVPENLNAEPLTQCFSTGPAKRYMDGLNYRRKVSKVRG